MKKLNLQLFAAANMTTAADLEPAISIDVASRINSNINELREVLGITDLEAVNAGTTIKMYKYEEGELAAQVGEGEEIGLTKIRRVLAKSVELVLKKYRRNTSAESIQKVGREVAINKTDEKLVSLIQREIKQSFYDMLLEGTGTAVAGANLQAACANVWAAGKKAHQDEDATMVYFVGVDDAAEYLGGAQVSTQTAFGMSYLKDFIGLGTMLINPNLPKGKIIGVAKENLRGAYIPTNSGDVARSFGLTSDPTGLVGLNHSIVTGNATIDTLVMSGVIFYPERLDAVIVGAIGTGA